MKDWNDLSVLEQVSLLALAQEVDLSPTGQPESEIPWRDRSPANAWFAELHPDYDDETLERLAQSI